MVSGGQEVVLPSGVKYKDVKIGGGSKPTKGYLMVVDFRFVATHAPLPQVAANIPCKVCVGKGGGIILGTSLNAQDAGFPAVAEDSA